MLKNIFNFALIFSAGSIVQARLTDNQVVIKRESDVVKIEPKKGFHLNAEAPATATFDGLEASYKPVTKTEKLLTFKTVPNTQKANFSYYVCDDKKTVCEQHKDEFVLTTARRSSNTAGTVAAATSAATAAPTPPAGSFLSEGASVSSATSPQQAHQLLVSKNGKPTLLIFSAPWCPACIRMQTETYSTPAVSAQLKKVNFVKLNNDLPENFDLAEKFHVRAIPTLILLNTDGEEVYRWLDYQPPQDFAESLQGEVKNRAESKASLLKRAQQGDSKAISAVGHLYYNALDYPEAIKWFSMSKSDEDLKIKLASEISLAQDQSEKDEKLIPGYLQKLEKGITLSSSKIDRVRWMVDWIEKKKEQGPLSEDVKAKAQNLVIEIEAQLNAPTQLIREFRQSTFGEAAGFELAEVNLMRSRLYGALENSAAKRAADSAVITNLKDRKLSVEKPGEMLLGIAYLREAGEKNRVEKMYQQLLKTYPNTYVYHEKYARYLLKNKSLDQALAQSDLALDYAEGNQPQLYLLKARILIEQHQKEKALQTIGFATGLEDIQHAKYRKILAQLNKLKEEVSQK